MADSIEVLRAALRYIEHTANGKQELLVEQMRNAIRALSPAGCDWVMVDGRRYAVETVKTALLGLASDVLAASTQQEPGAVPSDDELPGMWERADLIGGATDCVTPANDPSGQTLAGAGGGARINALVRLADDVWAGRVKADAIRDRVSEILGTATSAGTTGDDSEDAARLDFIERTFSGMTNRERYLPVQMIWGKGCNGRTLREACDKYMRKEDAARRAREVG